MAEYNLNMALKLTVFAHVPSAAFSITRMSPILMQTSQGFSHSITCFFAQKKVFCSTSRRNKGVLNSKQFDREF